MQTAGDFGEHFFAVPLTVAGKATKQRECDVAVIVRDCCTGTAALMQQQGSAFGTYEHLVLARRAKFNAHRARNSLGAAAKPRGGSSGPAMKLGSIKWRPAALYIANWVTAARPAAKTPLGKVLAVRRQCCGAENSAFRVFLSNSQHFFRPTMRHVYIAYAVDSLHIRGVSFL